MESYSRGRRGVPAKDVGVAMRARVQIPHSPPSDNNPNTYVRVVLFLLKIQLTQIKRKISPFDKISKCFDLYNTNIEVLC